MDTSDVKPNRCRGFPQCTEVSKIRGKETGGCVEVSPNIREPAKLMAIQAQMDQKSKTPKTRIQYQAAS